MIGKATSFTAMQAVDLRSSVCDQKYSNKHARKPKQQSPEKKWLAVCMCGLVAVSGSGSSLC